MQNFLKTTFSILLAIAFGVVSAQDLATKIPKNSTYVFTYNGQNILKKMSISDFQTMPISNEFIKEISKKRDESIELEDMGIKWGSEMYFFTEFTDSMNYMGFLASIKDKKKFKENFVPQYEEVKEDNGLSIVSGNSYVIMWDKDYVIMLNGQETYNMYTEPAYYEEAYEMESWEYPMEEMEIQDWPELEEDVEYIEQEMEEVDEAIPEPDDVEIQEYYEMEEMEVIEDEYISDEGYISVYEQRELDQKKKLLNKAMGLRSLKNSESIMSDPQFLKSIDNDADAVFYGGDPMSFMSQFLFGMGRYNMGYGGMRGINNYGLMGMMNMMSGSVNVAKLYFEKDQIMINNESQLNSELFDVVKKISNGNLNAKFYNYIPSQSPLAYYSLAVNSKAMLEEIPALMAPMYEGAFQESNVDVSDILDLYSIVLDEDAISKVFTGDALFVMNSIRPVEIEYTTYDWDENFNSIETQAVKTEIIPEFVIMASTEDSESIDKLFKLIGLSGELEYKDQYYQVKGNEYSSFQMFMTVKDGIVFFCNTQEQLNYILAGGGKSKLNKDHIKAISNNTSVGFVDTEMILRSIPDKEVNNTRSKQTLDHARENVKEIRFIQSKPDNGMIKSKMTMEIPAGNTNSLTYILELMNDFYKIEKRIN